MASTSATVDDGGVELDELTVRRAKKRDPDALRRLIETYRRPVGALLYRMLSGREAEVEDAAQETFLRVVRAIDRFDPAGSAKLSTWILTIATRIAIDRLRAARPELEVPSTLASTGPSPEDAAHDSGLAARVRRHLTALPADARAALVLRAYHDLDYDEIARIQAVEVGTVKSRIARARAALKVAMKEQDR